ncbi:FKBP-type peptidyl-prolyl cis-trans isomerase [Kaistella carnis]|uniref:FKBP-type peptidyl-prolyl cis-trans isomerase n=1 Tax=Kaistella carnis TaxID=1241979 RepID=UPI0028ABC7A4|nr:FKBP-type peptidyl-prolyl cis-trans isomerase [Kaistella carnis]
MKRIFLFSILLLMGCMQQAPSHPPVGGFLGEKEMADSKNRTKNLNLMERQQIQEWIKMQDEKFYPMNMNYWVNDSELQNNSRKADGEMISYQYDIYDFDKVKLYETPKENINVSFGHFEELKPVEDALRHMNKNQEVILLIPSALGFGTYGDQDKIPNDMPLIIKLKVL